MEIAVTVAGGASFDNRSLRQLHLGFIYTPAKSVELGAEFFDCQRKTFDGDSGNMSRVHLMARYSF